MLQNNPGLTPAQIYTAMRSNTSPLVSTLDGTTFTPVSGYGFIKADAALASTGAGGAVTVNLDLSPTTINVGAVGHPHLEQHQRQQLHGLG